MRAKLVEFMVKTGSREVFGAGEVVVRAGDRSEWMYWVESGFVRQYALSIEGAELTVFVYGEGAVFFGPWLFGQVEARHYFEAVTEVVVWKVRRDRVEEWMGKNPEVGVELIKNGFGAVKLLMLQVEAVVFGSACQKIVAGLVMLAARFGRDLGGGKVRIRVPLTHRLLATMVGMARETVTTELGELKRMGVVVQEGRWVSVVDMEKAQELAQMELGQVLDLGEDASV